MSQGRRGYWGVTHAPVKAASCNGPAGEALATPRRLRVGLHVGQLLQDVPGGIGRVTELLCEHLPDRADVTAYGAGTRAACAALQARLGPRIEFHRTFAPSPALQYAWWHRFRRPHPRVDSDVCHAPSLAVPPSVVPLVVTINDLAFLHHPQTSTSRGIRFHERGLELARREAAAIIVPSYFTRDELVREGFDPSRIHRVPLSAKRNASAVSAVPLQRLPARYLLVVGTLEPRKDHACVVAAFTRLRRRHPDLALLIAGPRGWLTAAQIAALEVPGVHLLGYVHDSVLDGLYERATVVIDASNYEGFGLTVLEALAHARPVVASDIAAHS